jgi:hypothetical protein
LRYYYTTELEMGIGQEKNWSCLETWAENVKVRIGM